MGARRRCGIRKERARRTYPAFRSRISRWYALETRAVTAASAATDASVAALAAVCARVSRAFERLILERKVR
jgi:hypothetical protein